MDRSRAFDITIHVIQSEINHWLPCIKAKSTIDDSPWNKILISGIEQSPTVKGPSGQHIHVYVEFTNQKSWSACKKLLRLEGLTSLFRVANKNDYIRIRDHHIKTESKIDQSSLLLFEWPTCVVPNKESTTKLKLTPHGFDIRAAVEAGDLESIKDWNYKYYISHKATLDAECLKFKPKTLDTIKEHLWIVGETGSGKTAYIHKLYPGNLAYWKDMSSPKYEQYNHEEVVVWDDMDNKCLRMVGVNKLKTLTNPAGALCEVKYSSALIKAKHIITSQYTIKDCFVYKGAVRFGNHNKSYEEQIEEIEQDPDYHAIKRRFKEITITKFLFQEGLQLKCKSKRDAMTPEEQANYDLFEPYDSEHKVDVYSQGEHSVNIDDTISCTETGQSLSKESILNKTKRKRAAAENEEFCASSRSSFDNME